MKSGEGVVSVLWHRFRGGMSLRGRSGRGSAAQTTWLWLYSILWTSSYWCTKTTRQSWTQVQCSCRRCLLGD